MRDGLAPRKNKKKILNEKRIRNNYAEILY